MHLTKNLAEVEKPSSLAIVIESNIALIENKWTLLTKQELIGLLK
jgi:hypothetical protein